MGLGNEPIEIVLRAEHRIHALVVRDVVAAVEAGRRVDRRQPDRIDAQAVRSQVVEMVDDPGQVADPVAVRVGEAPRIDLVDHAALPPVVAEPCALDRGVPAHPGEVRRRDARGPAPVRR